MTATYMLIKIKYLIYALEVLDDNYYINLLTYLLTYTVKRT